MNPRALFIINSDPRSSPRPGEAVRIATGVGVWKKIDVTICLCEWAVLALGEATESLVDGDDLANYWAVIAEWGRPVFLKTGEPLLKNLGQTPARFERINTVQLAQLASQSDYVLRF